MNPVVGVAFYVLDMDAVMAAGWLGTFPLGRRRFDGCAVEVGGRLLLGCGAVVYSDCRKRRVPCVVNGIDEPVLLMHKFILRIENNRSSAYKRDPLPQSFYASWKYHGRTL